MRKELTNAQWRALVKRHENTRKILEKLVIQGPNNQKIVIKQRKEKVF